MEIFNSVASRSATRYAGSSGGSAAALHEEMQGMGWSIVEEADLRWTLRQDARTETTYSVRFTRAKK